MLRRVPRRWFSKKITTHETTNTGAWGTHHERTTTTTTTDDTPQHKIPRLRTTIHTPSEPFIQLIKFLLIEISKHPEILKTITTGISDGIHRLGMWTNQILLGASPPLLPPPPPAPSPSDLLIRNEVIAAMKLKPEGFDTNIVEFLSCNYSILGLPKGANKATCKIAYHQLCKKWHPDHNQDPNAEDVFRLITKAFHSVLADIARDQKY